MSLPGRGPAALVVMCPPFQSVIRPGELRSAVACRSTVPAPGLSSYRHHSAPVGGACLPARTRAGAIAGEAASRYFFRDARTTPQTGGSLRDPGRGDGARVLRDLRRVGEPAGAQ